MGVSFHPAISEIISWLESSQLWLASFKSWLIMKLIADLVRLLTTDHDLSRVVFHDSKPLLVTLNTEAE